MLALINRLRMPGRLVVVATHDVRFDPLADAVLDMGRSRRQHGPRGIR